MKTRNQLPWYKKICSKLLKLFWGIYFKLCLTVSAFDMTTNSSYALRAHKYCISLIFLEEELFDLLLKSASIAVGCPQFVD